MIPAPSKFAALYNLPVQYDNMNHIISAQSTLPSIAEKINHLYAEVEVGIIYIRAYFVSCPFLLFFNIKANSLHPCLFGYVWGEPWLRNTHGVTESFHIMHNRRFLVSRNAAKAPVKRPERSRIRDIMRPQRLITNSIVNSSPFQLPVMEASAKHNTSSDMAQQPT